MKIQLLVNHEHGCQSIINIKVHNNVMSAGSYDSDKIAKFSCLLWLLDILHYVCWLSIQAQNYLRGHWGQMFWGRYKKGNSIVPSKKVSESYPQSRPSPCAWPLASLWGHSSHCPYKQSKSSLDLTKKNGKHDLWGHWGQQPQSDTHGVDPPHGCRWTDGKVRFGFGANLYGLYLAWLISTFLYSK